MSDMEAPRKEVEGLTPTSTLVEGARRVLKSRLGAVADRLEDALAAAAAPPADPEQAPGVREVHRLRVATRRAAAALEAFEPACRARDAKRVRKRLKAVRRAAGAARDLDVFSALFTRVRSRAPEGVAPVIDGIQRVVAERRAAAWEDLRAALQDFTPGRFRKARKRLLERLRDPGIDGDGRGEPTLLCDAARDVLRRRTARLRVALDADLHDLERLHEFRIEAKRLRYAAEVFQPCLTDAARRDLLPKVEEMQELLGAVNDSHRLAEFLRGMLDAGPGAGAAGADPDALRALAERCAVQRDDRKEGFLEWLEGLKGGAFFETLEHELAAGDREAGDGRVNAPPVGADRPEAPAAADDAAPRWTEAHANGSARPWRVAAIDVGTNSIRLMVAEAYGGGNYKVLDDEREIARLGRGLALTGALDPGAMEQSVVVVAHMRRIAEGYGVERLRAIGTAAVREATNGEAFVRMLKDRAGVHLEVISPEQEAKLAYLSASHAFDLRSLPSAVVDIGGGSTEIVLCSGGLVERVYSMPLGAVRLTEAFGGPEASAGERLAEMRRHIRDTLAEGVGEPPMRPQMVIGSGGTFEALAKIAMQREHGPGGGGTVRGYDMRRDDVREILRELRGMPLRVRQKIPGLSASRAEIIVAGVAIVDGALDRLGADRLRAHDGGVRDGLLLAMMQEFFAGDGVAPGESSTRAKARAVRRFASGCNYERRHCVHVAGLALQIHEQLARGERWAGEPAGRWRDADARDLLDAAATLHDCGYHINYNKHHLHSYHLIMHSDMPGFTRREIEIVANVARYHRGPEPKGKHPSFDRLSRADKDLVRALAAILRVADGLDRTHMQNVAGVRVEPAPDGRVLLTVDAASDPAVDVWGSARKSEGFAALFGTPDYRWAGAPADAPPASADKQEAAG